MTRTMGRGPQAFGSHAEVEGLREGVDEGGWAWHEEWCVRRGREK